MALQNLQNGIITIGNRTGFYYTAVDNIARCLIMSDNNITIKYELTELLTMANDIRYRELTSDSTFFKLSLFDCAMGNNTIDLGLHTFSNECIYLNKSVIPNQGQQYQQWLSFFPRTSIAELLKI